MRSPTLVRALTLVAYVAVAAAACDDSPDPPPAGSGDLGGDPGAHDDMGVTDGPATGDRDAAVCATVSSVGNLARKPIDIIFVIDNSGSMTDEIEAVQANLDTAFAQIIGASNLDYRIIMLSAFGSAAATQSICIAAPLSGDSCVPPLPRSPTNGPRYFHYPLEIGSRDSFSRILGSYDGWSGWLRPGAAKIFVEITDDNDNQMPFTAFDAALRARSTAHFGTESNRNYVFHAITGLAPKANPVEAYLPTEPIVPARDKCPTSENSGTSYQELARLTGGLRFPICDPSKFSTVFTVIAKGIVTGAQVACELDVPPVEAPAAIDFSSVRVEYQPSTGAPPQTFTQAADAASCGPGRFYIGAGGTRVILCPETCQAVQVDPKAAVRASFECSFPIP
jgi:hypothetical protein